VRIPSFIPTADGVPETSLLSKPVLMPFRFAGALEETLSPESPNTWFPLQVSIEKCVEWFWRVESWYMDITASRITDVPFSISLTDILLRNRRKNGTDERDLITAPFGDYDSFGAFKLYLDDETPTFEIIGNNGGFNYRLYSFSFYFLNSLNDEVPNYKLSEGAFPNQLMLPSMGVNLAFSYVSDDEFRTGAYEGFSYLNIGGDYVSGSCSIDGENISIQMRYAPSGTLPEEQLDEFNIVLRPRRYFAYAKPGGIEPIWDSTTGVQLRDTVTGALL